MPNVATPSHHPLQRGGRGVDGRPDVEIEDRFARRLRIGGVIVDHVADLFGRAGWGPASNVPIVAVEGGLGAGNEGINQ